MATNPDITRILDTIRPGVLAYLTALDRTPPTELGHDSLSEGMDVRLQVVVTPQGSDWYVLTGDPQYDQDHRGSWGATSVPWFGSDEEYDPAAVASDLLSQVEDDLYDRYSCHGHPADPYDGAPGTTVYCDGTCIRW